MDGLPQQERGRMETNAVTGAWPYSGRAIEAALLRDGHRVVSLAHRIPPDPDPHRGRVIRHSYGQFSVPELGSPDRSGQAGRRRQAGVDLHSKPWPWS